MATTTAAATTKTTSSSQSGEETAVGGTLVQRDGHRANPNHEAQEYQEVFLRWGDGNKPLTKKGRKRHDH